MGKPLILLVRDGWGIAPPGPGNAVHLANTPNVDSYLAKYPNCVLVPSGEAVGVREGAQGSSEVGHLNLGAGRIVEQEILRVDKLIASGKIYEEPLLVSAVENCKEHNSAMHFMGLVQDQGVHATQEHLFALLKLAKKHDLKKVYVHFFADGRDTPPRSALTYLEELEKQIAQIGVGEIASVMGRYYSMDRGKNWERTRLAYDALLFGKGRRANSARAAIEEAYARADAELAHRGSNAGADEAPPETDEFIQPTLIAGDDGEPIGLIRENDSVVHFNYRQDRALQLTWAFVEDDFDGWERGPKPNVCYRGLTRYYDEFKFGIIPPMNMKNLLGDVLAERGLWMLRISEFQKFRHVTSFFNGKMIAPFPGEDRILVDSISIPEDQKPEMSAYEVAELAVTAIADGISAAREKTEATDGATLTKPDLPELDAERGKDTYDVIVLNYANCDMVGHTGSLEAAIKAVEAVDECVGKVVEATLARDGIVLLTADHGNAEQMIDEATGGPHTAHTTNDVECILIGNSVDGVKLRERGILADVTLTMLQILDIEPPPEMTAQSLIESGL